MRSCGNGEASSVKFRSLAVSGAGGLGNRGF